MSINDEDYFLKWILLESQIQHDQEKNEVKETDKKINMLQYEYEYLKSFLIDVENISHLWNPIDIKKYKNKYKKIESEIIYFKECRKYILNKLRDSDDYGLNNNIRIT